MERVLNGALNILRVARAEVRPALTRRERHRVIYGKSITLRRRARHLGQNAAAKLAELEKVRAPPRFADAPFFAGTFFATACCGYQGLIAHDRVRPGQVSALACGPKYVGAEEAARAAGLRRSAASRATVCHEAKGSGGLKCSTSLSYRDLAFL
jgi:hypothetical protein